MTSSDIALGVRVYVCTFVLYIYNALECNSWFFLNYILEFSRDNREE